MSRPRRREDEVDQYLVILRRLERLELALSGQPFGDAAQFSGPFSASAPPDALTGTMLETAIAGWHVLDVQIDAFSVVVAAHLMTVYLDGASVATRTFFFSAANVHQGGIRVVTKVQIERGQHFVWIRWAGSSDSEDKASIVLHPLQILG